MSDYGNLQDMRTAILRNRINGVEVRVHATTNHPSSSYGLPVWVDKNGEAYCQCDLDNPFYEVTELNTQNHG